MARLNSFRVDSRLIEQGEWVSPGEEYDDLEILTRGLTDQYSDARAAKLRRAALRYGGDVNKLPGSITRDITVECMIDHVLLDVRHLSDEDGNPIDFAGFKELLRNPDYSDLVIAALKAAAIVGTQRIRNAEDAEKNSPKHSKRN